MLNEHYMIEKDTIVWLKPKITLIGEPLFNGLGLREHLEYRNQSWLDGNHGESGELLSETAGRVCYNSFTNPRPGGSKEYHNHVIKEGHGSIYTHANYTFAISGVTRALTHELVRHHVGTAISQASQRYVDQGVYGMVAPQPFFNEHWDGYFKLEYYIDDFRNAMYMYNTEYSKRMGDIEGKLDNRDAKKYARGCARKFLPECSATELIWTMNLRAARNIIEQRCSEGADWEIRRLANQFYLTLMAVCPMIFADYERCERPDGTFSLTTPNRKI